MATKKNKHFDASMFAATDFYSAEDKAWFGNYLLDFIAADFPRAKFTKKFYERLSSTFGHIAHYDLLGFWQTFFESTADKVEFLRQTLNWSFYGHPETTFSDVEKAVQSVLRSSSTLAIYESRCREEAERAEKELLRRLKAKHEGSPEAPVQPLTAAVPALTLDLSPPGKSISGERIPPLSAFLSEAFESDPEIEAANQLLLF
jgi:hypothetical protein